MVRMLIELVDVRFPLAQPGLHLRPCPRMPTECCISRKIACGLGHSRFAGWIRAQQAIGEGAVTLARVVDIFLGTMRRRETRAFVRGVSNQRSEERRVGEER